MIDQLNNIFIKKKDGTKEKFNPEKIVNAVSKSAYRALSPFSNDDLKYICDRAIEKVSSLSKTNEDIIDVPTMHNIVESILDEVNPNVAKSYRDYRNYKQDFVNMIDGVYKKAQSIMYIGDRSNANTDSTLASTKRSLIYSELNKKLYQKFFMTTKDIKACKDGYIYIHDMSARRDCINCCLFDMGNVLKNGFFMGNVFYNEPNTLDVAFDVISDVTLSAASQQYGGFTIPEVDKILKPYAEKSYKLYYDRLYKMYRDICSGLEIGKYDCSFNLNTNTKVTKLIEEEAVRLVERDFEQGFQGWEMKFNTVASSRGDYPFTTITFGLGTSKFEKMASRICLNVRSKGQGKKGFERPVLFPKLVFLYDENLHGEGKINEDIFEVGVETSSKCMYPDWLSLTGEGYVPDMYKKYNRVVSPMGCRAFLSPYFEKGGMNPIDENDKPFFTGRFNGGAISLNLPMIYMKSEQECRDFFEVLDEYLILIRNIHKRTYDYIGEFKASTNPLAFCEGGLLGHLDPNEPIRPLLKSMTLSFGITALNELQELYNEKSLVTDGEFSIKVMEYINNKISQFKEEDDILYAIYGTPAEQLCQTQVKQFRKKYGIIPNVSDKEYFTNSFHCHVAEDISPVQKQNLENRFWDLFRGGRIQYVRYDNNYNTEAFRILIRRAMNMGFYEGINMEMSYCELCGNSFLNGTICPECQSTNVTQLNRVCGYLGYSLINGDTRMNDGKMAEIKDRKSM